MNKTKDKMDFRDDIVNRFVNEVALTRQSCDSFDDFIFTKLKEIIAELRPISCTYFGPEDTREIGIRMTGGTVKPPVMLENDGTSRPCYPSECRIRHLTYGAPLYIDVEVSRKGKEGTILKDVYLGRIPVMVFSSLCYLRDKKNRLKHDECPNDPGGYFIVNGNEKSLVGQKSSMKNRMIAYAKKNTCAVAVKSEIKRRVYITTISYKPMKPIMCTFPRLQNEVPLMDILLALGLNIEDIKSVFDSSELALLDASFKNLPDTQQEAKDRLPIREVYNVGSSEDERLQNAFKNVMLPHVDMDKKGLFFLNMVKELIAVAKKDIPPTDRDAVNNQRVETACELLSTLFHHLMIKLSNDIKLMCQKSLGKLKRGITDEKIRKWFSSITSITDGFQYALATGNWNTTFVNRTQRVGVAQALQRLTLISTISQLRRISSAIDSTQKLAKPRYLHGTHWGRYCPFETPEGQPCGLETQLSVQALVSLDTNPFVIEKVIRQYLLPIDVKNLKVGNKVYVNGKYMGNTKDIKKLLSTVRKLRRTGQCAKDISVSCNTRHTCHISSTSGRLCRPLLIVKNNKILYKEKKHGKLPWCELLTRGLIEYMDCEEEDTMLVAFDPSYLKKSSHKYTHCEISCSMIMGLCAASIPFSDHNPATRNTYQSAMGKQAQGVPVTNYQSRFDTTQNILHYGQRPLVSTKLADLYGIHECPAGQNCIVAIMPWEGFGQEDSIVVNQHALDRGLGRADRYKTINETLSSNKEKSCFQKPERKRKFGKYDKLDDDGFVNPGTKILKRDCIIGKQVIKGNSAVTGMIINKNMIEDASILSDVEGRVDKVIMYQQRDGERAVKMKLRTQRIPTIGDKFSSRHGQKGTIGMTFGSENLPWNMDGIVPDIIVNPHALPSRMTIAHLIETLAGKKAAITGKFVDSSPFNGLTVEDIAAELKQHGFNSHGNEQLYSGYTGEPIQAKIFMGPIYYQRLKHMVDDKIHVRGRGRRNALTGQPNEGRKHGCGLRVGEMEKDSFNSHGVPYVINERMMISSDAKKITICPKCQKKINTGSERCNICGESSTSILMPSAADLLLQELQSMCINVKLIV